MAINNKMRTYKRWTKEEELVILSNVKENPENLLKAFAIAAKKLNRSEASIRLRWYNRLKDSYSPVFMVYSNKKAIINGKNLKEKAHCSFFNKIKLRITSFFK